MSYQEIQNFVVFLTTKDLGTYIHMVWKYNILVIENISIQNEYNLAEVSEHKP